MANEVEEFHVRALQISPHKKLGLLASGCDDKTIKLFDIWDDKRENMNSLKHIKTLEGHTDNVMCLAFSKDDPAILASGGQDKKIIIWNVVTGECIKIIEGHKDAIYGLYFSKKLLISGEVDGTIKIWNATNYNLINSIKAHEKTVTSIVLTPDENTMLSASYDGEIKVWSLDIYLYDKCEIEYKKSLIKSPYEKFTYLKFLNDDIVVSASELKLLNKKSEGKIKLWNYKIGSYYEFIGHTDKVNYIDFFDNGTKLVSCARDNTVKISDIETVKCLSTLQFSEVVWSVAATEKGVIYTGDNFGNVDGWKPICNVKGEIVTYDNPISVGIENRTDKPYAISSPKPTPEPRVHYDVGNPHYTFQPAPPESGLDSVQSDTEQVEENIIPEPSVTNQGQFN